MLAPHQRELMILVFPHQIRIQMELVAQASDQVQSLVAGHCLHLHKLQMTAHHDKPHKGPFFCFPELAEGEKEKCLLPCGLIQNFLWWHIFARQAEKPWQRFLDQQHIRSRRCVSYLPPTIHTPPIQRKSGLTDEQHTRHVREGNTGLFHSSRISLMSQSVKCG